MKNFILILCFIASSSAFAQKKNKAIYATGGIAVKGYDVVSYFDGKAEPGLESLTSEYKGFVFQFSSVENKVKFDNSSQAYIPEYGGWCAYAMGNSGRRVSINPETFELKKGKVYLFYNKGKTNTLLDWRNDRENLKKKADKNWKRYVNN